MSWRRLRGHRFVMHFVGDGFGFLRRVLVVVFAIAFLIGVLIVFSISVLIILSISVLVAVQRFLQLFELRGFHKLFGHRFDGFGAVLCVSLRFFMLGLGQLFCERVYVFVGKACAIRSMRVRDLRLACFGYRQGRCNRLRRAGKRFAALFRSGSFMLFRNGRGAACVERARQSRRQFFIRENPRRRRRGGSSPAERRRLGRRRRRRGRNAILEFGERLARQDDGLEIRGRRFVRLGLARPGIGRRSVLGRRQIAPGPAVAPSASAVGAPPAPVAPAALSAAIAKAAAPAVAVVPLLKGRTLAALHRRSRRHAAFGGILLAGGGNLKGFALEGRDSGSSLKSLCGLNGTRRR